jgi:hypothetical protein
VCLDGDLVGDGSRGSSERALRTACAISSLVLLIGVSLGARSGVSSQPGARRLADQDAVVMADARKSSSGRAALVSTFVMISQNRADAKQQVLADQEWRGVLKVRGQNASAAASATVWS